MARWYRRRSTTRRRYRRGSVGALVAMLLIAILLLVLLMNGETLNLPALPRLNLPPLPNVTIPITGFPKIELPNIIVQVTEQPVVPATGGNPVLGPRTKTTGCVARGNLPDTACTPGAVVANVTSEQVCTPGYASSVRNVPQSVKEEVYAAYGITNRAPGQYEIDHLVNLSIGGTNDLSNLWPEAVSPKPGANEKDQVENYLHDQVCSGKISLQEAQRQIATNWQDVYNRMPK